MADYPPGAHLNGGYHDQGHGGAPKRHRDDEYGANKRPAYGGGSGPETVFRFLCDYKIVGGMIGKGGANLKEVQQNTGAFIEVIHEAPPHCTERVFIIASPRDAPGSGEFNSAQIALFSIFDKQLGLERHACPPGGPFLRMLICASQAGSLIGKSGVTIKELKEQSGCSNIKVLQPDDLPPCGLSTDKLLHITGPPESLRRVLQLASTRLRDSPPKEPPSHEPCKNAYPPAPPMGAPPPGYMGGPPPGYMPPPPGAAGAPGAPQY